MYPTKDFRDWLAQPPEHLLKDEAYDDLMAWKEAHQGKGLKPDAPQSAKDAYQKFLNAMTNARSNGRHIRF